MTLTIDATTEQFEEIYRKSREDIFYFAELLGFKPTWQQKLVLQAVQYGEKRVACKSGQGPGKTTVSAIVGMWRSWRFPRARTVVTAPTMRQCRDVWLKEARRLVTDTILEPLIKVTRTRIEMFGDPDWGVILLTATSPEAAQGQHNEHLTFIAEEASGIERGFIEQIIGTLTNPDSLFLQIGNPNTRECAFFDCFNSQKHRWHTITFNAEEAPDWLVSKDQHLVLAELYGRDSDVYRVRVLGEFPTEDPNCVISSDVLYECVGLSQLDMARMPRDKEAFEFAGQIHHGPARQMGIDFARFGSDESTIYVRSGNAIVDSKVFVKTDPNDVVDVAFKLQKDRGWADGRTLFIADAGGMGQGVMANFYRAGKRVFEFHNGGRAANSKEYENKITEAWFHLGKLARRHQMYLPNDIRLIQQLSTRQYYTTNKGKLCVESKDEYMKRGYDSPDRADGIVMAMYDQISLAGRTARRSGSGKRVGSV